MHGENRCDHTRGLCRIRFVGRVNRGANHITHCIRYDMTLSPFDLFPAVKAAFLPSRFGGSFDTLAVDRGSSRFGIASRRFSALLGQRLVQLRPGPLVTPLLEVVKYDRPWGKVMRAC